jgi:hypothetical protein
MIRQRDDRFLHLNSASSPPQQQQSHGRQQQTDHQNGD